jgi:hypothetical protein
VFGVAIVLMMMVRPQGLVTRAMVKRLSLSRLVSRRTTVGAVHDG